MKPSDNLRRIAQCLVGIDPDDFSTAENKIAEILVSADICEWEVKTFPDAKNVAIQLYSEKRLLLRHR